MPKREETDRPRIVLVEDDSDFRTIMARWLAPRYDVVSCADGEELFDELAVAKPDLIVLDIDLPGPNGFVLCRRLRSLSCYTSIPILFVTGSDRIQDYLETLKLGGDSFINKPVERPHLLREIRSLLQAAFA
ncbi:MAG: response regulator transcription factor [Elusimicrobia bacterium]|nr:response regulator transcription factor [Elusimicrobiota bacterium]